MIARLDSQLKAKLVTLLNQKTALSQEMEQLEALLLDVDNQLHTCTRSELIAKRADLSRILQLARKKPINFYVRSPVSADFQR